MNFKSKIIPNRTLEDVVADWMDAKNEEVSANKRRIEIEEEVLSFLTSKIEGAESHQVGPYKVTLTGRLNRKVDWDFVQKLGIPENMLPVKQKPELDLKGLRYLENNEPEFYKNFCKALTIEPAKTSVTVIRTEK
tara:strand:- start:652 stop:1056 length:405 start_codon:yes stop_codon:yes gene_type:complete